MRGGLASSGFETSRKIFRSDRLCRGFTLIEVMVVVGISLVLLTIAVPAFVSRLSPQSMQKAVRDITELMWRARADAILTGVTTAVQVRPHEGTFRVVKIGTAAPAADASEVAGAGAGANGSTAVPTPVPAPRPSSEAESDSDRFKKLDPAIVVEGLGINGEDWTEDEMGEARFYPNGTADDFAVVLRSQKGELRKIYVEVVTGLSEVETDPNKFVKR